MKRIVIIGVSFLFLASCGARKKDVSNKEEVYHLEQNDALKTVNELDLDIATISNTKASTEKSSTSTKKTYAPIDNTKPSSVTDSNGKTTVLNNASLVEEESTGNEVSKNETNTDHRDKSNKKESSKQSGSLVIDARTKENDMHLEKEDSSTNWWLWLLGISIIGFTIWKLYDTFNIKKRVTDFFTK
jgi:hypothetical protein